MAQLGFLQVLVATLIMSFRIVCMALGGFFLVKRGVIDKAVSRKIGGVIVDLLTPCLIFGKIIPNFDITQWKSWVPILIFTFLCIFLGFGFGYFLACICRVKRKTQRNLMAVVTGFAHTGSIQLTLSITLAHTLDQIGGVKECHLQPQGGLCPSERATSYIVLVWVLSATLRWSVGYAMMAPEQHEQPILDLTMPTQENRKLQNQSEIRAQDFLNKSYLDSSHITTSGEDNTISYIDASFKRQTLKVRKVNDIVSPPGPKKLSCREKCKKTMNMPVLTSIVALVIASIPYTKELFYPKGAIFYSTILSTASFIGSANYILMIIVLGANLSIFKKEKTRISLALHFVLVYFRLLVYPLVGIGVVYYGGYKLGFIEDKMMVFVLLIMYATPPANNLMIMATMQKNLESDLARNLLISYLSCIVTLTLYIAFFLYMIQL